MCRELRDPVTGELVRGGAAVALLEREYRKRQTVVVGDVKYSAAADAARRVEFEQLRFHVFPQARREGKAAARELDGRDWCRWRRMVKRGEVIATKRELAAYDALRPQPLPRTVNGTGHTDPSEFCATSL